MQTLGLEDWDYPERRKALVQEALERWDERVLAEGVWAYLVRHRKKPDRNVPILSGRFVAWLALKGRRWPHLEAGDIRAFLEEARNQGFPGSRQAPLSPATVERARGAVGHFLRFLEWAGHPMPAHVDYPPREFIQALGRRPLSEEEWEGLLKRVETYTPAYWRPLLKVLLVLMGEVGITLKEALGLWREDLNGGVLRVRGTRLREVPLPPLARETLEDWLPQRDFLASHRPLPYPQLLLNPSKRSRGKPLSLAEGKWLLREFWKHAGVKVQEGKSRLDPALRLRWRAIRNLLKAGHPREKVAYWTGMRSLAILEGWDT